MAKLLGRIGAIIGMKQIEDPTVTLPAGYCQLISNYYKNDGVWFQRTGATKVLGSATGQPIMGIKEVLWDDASKSIIVASGDKWYTDSGTGCTTLTAIKSGLVNNQKINVKQFKISGVSNAIIASKIIPTQKWNKTILSNLTTTLPLDFSSLQNTAYSTGQQNITFMIKDSTNTYLYAITSDSPAKIIKVQLSNMAVISTLTLTAGHNGGKSLAIDPTNSYLYAGFLNQPFVDKITLSDFTTIVTLNLTVGETSRALAIDSTGTFMYVASRVIPSNIIKITLATFTETTILPLAAGEDEANSLVIDSTNAYLYVGCGTVPGKIVKIKLSDFATMVTKTLAAGEGPIYNIVKDSTDTYLYISCYTSPTKIVKLAFVDFTTTSTVTLTGTLYPTSIVIDSTNTYLYVGTYSSPDKITRLTLSDFSTYSTVTFTGVSDNFVSLVINSDFYIYIGFGQTTGKIYQLTLSLNAQFAETHKSKMHLAGFENDIYRYMEYFSATANATDYVTANDAGALAFGTELSKLDTFKGIWSWGDYIIFWFVNNILVYYAGTNPNDFKLVKHINNVGSLSDDVVSMGADVWFPTLSGIRSLQTAIQNGEIVYSNKSHDIDAIWNTKVTAYPTNLDRISMKYDKIRNQIMILANDSANQGICFYVYSVGDKVWSTFNILGLGAAVSITAFEITQDGLIYFGTSDGNIYQLYSGSTDNGTAISYVIRPTTQYFGNSVNNKKVKYVRFGFEAAVTAGSISYDVDQKNIPRSTASIVIPSSGTKGMLYSKLIPVQNRGKSWDFTFTNCGLIREILFYGEVEGEK